mmetsp:Transcript_27754/g.57639  ORF Transcript_27754/g.57639 Transcript_27754/m.57639 type:complete len:107 (+) Transcript_27754:1-321(+)
MVAQGHAIASAFGGNDSTPPKLPHYDPSRGMRQETARDPESNRLLLEDLRHTLRGLAKETNELGVLSHRLGAQPNEFAKLAGNLKQARDSQNEGRLGRGRRPGPLA